MTDVIDQTIGTKEVQAQPTSTTTKPKRTSITPPDVYEKLVSAKVELTADFKEALISHFAEEFDRACKIWITQDMWPPRKNDPINLSGLDKYDFSQCAGFDAGIPKSKYIRAAADVLVAAFVGVGYQAAPRSFANDNDAFFGIKVWLPALPKKT